MKKSVSLLLSLLMVISIITSVPLTASAASTSDLKFKLSDSGKSYYVSDCKRSAKGELVIPSTYNGKPVTRIGDYAFYCCYNLSSITIPDSVTSIGQDAFYNCTNLTSVTIPDSVTSIDWEAFMYCESLKLITIPDSVTSIGSSAFYGCTSLESITVDSVNKKYSSVDGVLFNKKRTFLIQYPARKTDSSYTIPDSVTSIGANAFYKCKKLTSVTIPDSVTRISSSAFKGCIGLESATIGKSVTSIGYSAFYRCESLTSIKIPDSVTSIGDKAFEYCKSLSSITIPDSVKSIGFQVFRGCTSLASAIIGNGVTKIGEGAFSGCTSLKEIYWNAKNVRYFTGFEKIFYNAGVNSSGIKLVFGDSVERIPANAFKNVKKVTSITIPDTVKSIGYLAFYNTGYYNDRNNWDKSALYIGNHLIRAKTSLKGDYTIKNGTKTIADKAFLNRENITSVTIPGSVKNIGKNAFRSCKNLSDITIPDSVSSIGYLAFYDTGYYNNRRNWDKSALYIGNHLIRGRHSLEGTYSVKQGTITIADMAFRDCDKLTSVKIHSSVKNVGKDIFYQCDNI